MTKKHQIRKGSHPHHLGKLAPRITEGWQKAVIGAVLAVCLAVSFGYLSGLSTLLDATSRGCGTYDRGMAVFSSVPPFACLALSAYPLFLVKAWGGLLERAAPGSSHLSHSPSRSPSRS